jgi:sugar/nucleoside kinase (ribokinase family)
MRLPLPRKPVLTLGDVNPDIILPLGSSVPPSSAPDLQRARISGGGTVANVASGLSRLGIPTSFCGMTGDDAMGHLMEQLLEEDHVDTTHLFFTRKAFTNMVFAVVQPDGERTIFVWPPSGAAQSLLSAEDLDFDGSEYALIHFSSINLREEPSAGSILGFLEQHSTEESIFSFDMNLRMEFFAGDHMFQRQLERALEVSDIIFGSSTDEIEPLTGTNDPIKAAGALNPNACVISRLGKDGALCIDQQTVFHAPGYPVAVCDTIGAGDAFNSGFIAALYRGRSLQHATMWGNACAAMSITKAHARSCPTYEQLLAFAAAYHSPEQLQEIFSL